MQQLENLILWDDDVTDDGIAHLAGLTNITGLNLRKTKVTDRALEHLKGMKRLTKLNLTDTAVSDEGVARAKKNLPFFCTIIRGK
jgi:internalin A